MVTARRRAYNGIRHAIIFGHFPPGQQLKEEELSARFDVSRTPVRQAIRQLADEGLVQVGTNKRSYVTDISHLQAEEAFDLLAYLEGYAARLAAQRITPDELARLRVLHEELRVISSGERDEDYPYLEKNSEFHSIIHEASRNQILLALLKRVSDLPYAMYLKFRKKTEDGDAIGQHERILVALETGDQTAAELHMRVHIESIRNLYRALSAEHKAQANGSLDQGAQS